MWLITLSFLASLGQRIEDPNFTLEFSPSSIFCLLDQGCPQLLLDLVLLQQPSRFSSLLIQRDGTIHLRFDDYNGADEYIRAAFRQWGHRFQFQLVDQGFLIGKV